MSVEHNLLYLKTGMSLDQAIGRASDWTIGYYNAVRFYYWEPELLNKVTKTTLSKIEKGTCTAADVLSRLDTKPGATERIINRVRRTEEPFNHLIEIFFRLCPKSVHDELAQMTGLKPFIDRPNVLSFAVERVFPGTQPDLLVIGGNQAILIEVKPPHGKSSAEQFAKYAYLLSALKKQLNDLSVRLIYLANGDLSDNFPKRDDNISVLRQSAMDWIIAGKKSVFRRMNSDEIDLVLEQISCLDIKWLNYSALAEIAKHKCASNETEQLLADGLIAEMQRRNYIDV